MSGKRSKPRNRSGKGDLHSSRKKTKKERQQKNLLSLGFRGANLEEKPIVKIEKPFDKNNDGAEPS